MKRTGALRLVETENIGEGGFEQVNNETELPEVAENNAEQVGTAVSISLNKSYPKRLINAMASANNANIEESESHYTISAPFIKVNRSDVETYFGNTITDAKWRLMFINRTGEVREFNNHEFSIGVPKIVTSEHDEETRETVQLNVRIDRAIKEELEKYRGKDYLDMTQPTFVEEALKEFIANIKRFIV